MRQGYKLIKILLPLIFFGFIHLMVLSRPTIALSFQDTVDVSFTFAPTIAISVDGQLTIPSLTVGDASDSNIITVTASTNSAHGYTLFSSVGSDTINYTDLRTTSTNTANVFSNLSTAKTALIDFGDNEWGYSYSTDSGSTWISGDIDSSTSGYNGLPLFNSINSGITLADSSTPNTTILNFKIAARAADTQPAGIYTNIVNFTTVVKIITTNYTLTYHANSGEDTVTNLPASASGTTTDSLITLDNGIPKREGHTFMGWCAVAVPDGAACTGDTYIPGRQFRLSSPGSAATINLYAMWQKPVNLYNFIATLSKGLQTNDDDVSTGIQASITTDNSGVYEYNSDVFGAASDAANTHKIYYYRGILDETVGTYGSDGDGEAWPNYIILSPDGMKSNTDTCWRIVRTTGSGGIKMIYNGTWTGTTCANAGANAQATTSAFNGVAYNNGYTSTSNYNIHSAGYTYNSAVNGVTSASADTTLAKVFGSNSDYGVNSSPSLIKQYLENTWFTTISSYESILEPSAGFCNDRSMGVSASWTTPLPESTQIVPYGTADMIVYHFAANIRNMSTHQIPTLNCPRGTVDVYSTSTAVDGNKQLLRPVALLTADEASFAGSGRSTPSHGSSHHANSYIRSGIYFRLLSPSYRSAEGNTLGFVLQPAGQVASVNVSNAYGVRPVISLAPGTTAIAGNGTASSPWVVLAP